jgi:hypothetical protein
MNNQRPRTVMLIVLLLAACSTVLAQTPVAAGYRDFGFGSLVAPTGEKPESKLWWNNGSWWGGALERATRRARHL